MDQAFSVSNLLKILNADNEKAGDLEEKYIPSAYEIRIRLRKFLDMMSFAKKCFRSKGISIVAYERRKKRLSFLLATWKIKHEALINSKLEEVSAAIGRKDFRVTLLERPIMISGKKIYGIGSDLSQILAVRFVQLILKSIYDVKIPSRDILVGQIKSLALDGVPKLIIRADVESFYESVRHQDLLDSIHRSSDLSVEVKRIITRMLKDYQRISASNKGLPRGVGVSAFLAEIYLSEVDGHIKKSSDLFYYARYVDDMVLMYAPSRPELADTYRERVDKIMNAKGLSLNHKTKVLNALTNQKGNFEYLGYEFDLAPGGSGVSLSKKKIDKYKARVKKSFADYHKKKSFIPKKAADELIVRSLFLTGNMRLFNRKSNAFIGIYFSNKHITHTKQLNGLDLFYKNQIKSITDASLRAKLLKNSFKEGFSKKIFRSLDPKQLSLISMGWRHD
ncbi:antiviral reverse transcriptase Drt3a [Burkholderia gladioli pv. alliicola]|uniref:antiviral reverse transcriptase Drt3a n=1 Tax=Burkholderia gladioli TaxID=28095 RepID=UPI001906D58E|nr:antiviral reverse transcriptase Drt3a [Burkholderia gladioli]MBJ9712981.1 RNA-directed DNA polymerase [Burkholderia gladioli]MDZ4036864.1 antiviral reverse transcriptase Drt3a [Burkholderia gladioli pv. alliicola]